MKQTQIICLRRLSVSAGVFCAALGLLVSGCERRNSATGAAEDAADAVEQAGKDAADTIRDASRTNQPVVDADKMAKEAEEAAERARKAARDAADAVKDGAKDAAKDVGRSLERAGEDLQKEANK